jgi:hypothetical protein
VRDFTCLRKVWRGSRTAAGAAPAPTAALADVVTECSHCSLTTRVDKLAYVKLNRHLLEMAKELNGQQLAMEWGVDVFEVRTNGLFLFEH